MKRLITIPVSASLVLLAGCSLFRSGPPPPPPISPGSPVPVVQACLQSNTKAATCDLNSLVCPVYVFNTPNGAVVYPYTLVVPRGQKVTIVWHLLEPKARFERTDGPLGLSAEFEDGAPTDDPNGAIAAPGSGKKYKFVYKNLRQSQTYPYTIQFRTQTGPQPITCDPNINNDAG